MNANTKLKDISDEEDELEHHGIQGQKWGVRRFQNKDGTRTPEGKKRYGEKDFNRTEKRIREKCSNTPKPFIKKETDISEVMSRSGLDRSDAKKAIALANIRYDEAAEVEPKITKDVISAVSKAGGKMYGLEYRLKQPTSLAGKIGADSIGDGISLKQAAVEINDAIRYTAVSETKDFVKNYNAIKGKLESEGYYEAKCKNYFQKYKNGESMHKAVQCTYKSPDGYKFELQFQTPGSQAAKELKIPIYEERRKVGISAERASELEAQMRDLAERVKDPPRIETIK